ncbi:hypothetical protein MPF19_14830 [Polaribacter sp. Z014]|uniref:MoaF-related domain-containing protein n=1 Tax=Polaribacter sp. Z014 TaxID=2927126 RepID=UPI0020217DC4|nr:hypothetical protein [Polaribacter sp. Z014]MCL7764697.1 hypothetical protein [Polaribacter sp. Z014]
MKAKLITLLCLALFTVGLGFSQNEPKAENNFQFGQAEHLLDGYSFNFQYQNGAGLHMEFKDGKAKYQWVDGPNKGNGNEDIPYRSTKLGNDMYLVNWHEIGLKDYLTIVFDFDKMLMHSSIIVGYQNKPERTLRTVFTSGIIDHLKRPE